MVKKPPQSACVKVLKKIRKQKECIVLHLFTKWRKAYMWNKTRKGAWALVSIPIPIPTIMLKKWTKRGYESMLKHHTEVSLSR